MASAFTPWLNLYVMSLHSCIALQDEIIHTTCVSYAVACLRTGLLYLLIL